MNTKKLTYSAMLIAIGTFSSHIIYIPVGLAKCYPIQHIINVLSAIILGPWYAVGNAFAISILRNLSGTGSPLAFPGSMLGGFLAGIIYQKTKKQLYGILGEVFGTGILGGLLAYPIAKFVLGNDVTTLFFVVPFLISTIAGSVIAYLILKALDVKQILNMSKSMN